MTQINNEDLQKEFFEIGRQRASERLIDFCIHTDKYYDPSWHHEIIGDALEAVEQNKIDRLLITIPPRHGKSELATIKFPAWFMGRNPHESIITASYSGDLATTFGRKVRNLMASPIYGTVFSTRLAEDSKSAQTWHTDEGGSYVASGVGGAITGKGAKVFLIDDPFKNREEAESEVFREKVWDWYTSVVYTRLEKDGAIVLIMTRWHTDDLAGRLLLSGEDKWVHIDLPAIAEKDGKYRKTGEALWEQKYNKEALARIKNNIGPYDWASLYQQQPINRETQEFKTEWFKYYDIQPQNINVTMTVDPAISKEDKACNSAIVVTGIDSASNIYVLDYVARKLDPSELIDEIMRLGRKWEPTDVGVESVAYQQAICYYLSERMDTEQFWLNIIEIRSRTKKEERIRGLIPLYSNGKIFHKRHHTELEHELENFPSGKLVDIIDALSMHKELWFRPETKKVEVENPYANDPTSPWGKAKKAKREGYAGFYSY